MLLADRPQPRGTITQQTVNTVSCPSHPWKRTFVARSGSGASNERDFQTSRNVRLRGTPIGPDAARRQPTRTWHCYLACALHTDPPGPLRACTCKTNPALAPNARAPAVQTRATRLTTGHKSIPARPGYAPSRLARPPAADAGSRRALDPTLVLPENTAEISFFKSALFISFFSGVFLATVETAF